MTERGPLRPAQLPPDNRFFTGRAEQLKELNSILHAAGTPIVAITGTAGVGKTTTAVHWAHEIADRFADGHLYVNLRGFDPSATMTPPAEALRGFLVAFGIAPERIPVELDARTAMFRSLLSDKRMLLVLDNARDADHVRPLLPGATGCLVVITSRNRLAGLVAAEGAHPVQLGLLTDDESWHLLNSRLNGARMAAEPGASWQIIERCARLPLALAVVAARGLIRPQTTLTSLVSELDSAKLNLDALSGDDLLTDVRAVFSWSYAALNPQAARVFRLLAVHPGPEVGTATVADMAELSVEQATLALGELVEAHLLVENSPERFGMHDLLRVYAAELLARIENDTQRDAAQLLMLDHYLHTAVVAAMALNRRRIPIPMPPGSIQSVGVSIRSFGEAQAWLTAEYTALCHCVHLANRSKLDNQTWRLAWSISDITIRQSRWNVLEAINQAALQAAKRLADPRGQGHAYRYLGLAACWLGRLGEGFAHLNLALEQFAVGHLDLEQGHVLLDLSTFCEHKPALCLQYSQQGLRSFQLAGDQTGQASALNSVGWAYCLLGDPNEGLSHAEQALQMQLGLDDPDGTAATLSTIGLAYHQLNSFERAASCYQESVDGYRRAGRRSRVADVLFEAGDSYLAAGRPDEAQRAWQEAKDIFDEMGVVREDLSRKLAELSS